MNHKKHLTVCIFFASLTLSASSQGLSNWFAQKQSEKKNLVAQVALFETYAGFLKKGYDIAHDGLHLIGDLKNGEFSLHKDYFSSLSSVSAVVLNYDKVPIIRRYYNDIILLRQQTMKSLEGGMPSGSDFLVYTKRVYDNLVSLCDTQIASLNMLLSDGNWQMKEDERLHRIDAIYDYMQDKYGFCQAFSAENKAYLLHQLQERSDWLATGKIYETE
jgi:hypothetical protein